MRTLLSVFCAATMALSSVGFSSSISFNDRKTKEKFNDISEANEEMSAVLKKIGDLLPGTTLSGRAKTASRTAWDFHFDTRYFKSFNSSLLEFKEKWEDKKWDFIRVDKAYKSYLETLPETSCVDFNTDKNTSCSKLVSKGRCSAEPAKSQCKSSCNSCEVTEEDKLPQEISRLFNVYRSQHKVVEDILYWVDERRCINHGKKDCEVSPLCVVSDNRCIKTPAPCSKYKRFPSDCNKQNHCYYDNSKSVCRDHSDHIGFVCKASHKPGRSDFVGTGYSKEKASEAAVKACERFHDNCKVKSCEYK